MGSGGGDRVVQISIDEIFEPSTRSHHFNQGLIISCLRLHFIKVQLKGQSHEIKIKKPYLNLVRLYL